VKSALQIAPQKPESNEGLQVITHTRFSSCLKCSHVFLIKNKFVHDMTFIFKIWTQVSIRIVTPGHLCSTSSIQTCFDLVKVGLANLRTQHLGTGTIANVNRKA